MTAAPSNSKKAMVDTGTRTSAKTAVLFVCMGNICRSPTAEGVFTQLAQQAGLLSQLEIDSAGTYGYHTGEPPDYRSQQAAAARGVDLSGLRARQVEAKDFQHYDYLLAMDRENLRALQRMAPPNQLHKIHLFLDFAPHLPEREVPDPYYGGPQGFEQVLDLVEAASQGLLAEMNLSRKTGDGEIARRS